MDIDRFLPVYLRRLGTFVGEAVSLPDFPQRFAQAVQAMIIPRTDGETNEHAFYASFREGLSDVTSARCNAAFADFYREVFPKLREQTRTIPGARRFIAAARQRGYRMTLATSPVFPLRAIVERLSWAAIGQDAFEQITCFENCRTVKPDPRYYEEVLRMSAAAPENVLMIGNDRRDDGAATLCGIPFAWIDGSFRRTADPIGKPIWHGTMNQLARAMEEGDAPFAR